MQDLGLTVCGRVERNEPGVHGSRILSSPPLDSVGMASQPVRGLVHVDIVVGPIQRPESSNSRAAAANNGHPFPDEVIS